MPFQAVELAFIVQLALRSIGTLQLTAQFPHAEGRWEDVFTVIGQAHTMLHLSGTVRIQSDIRVGTRTDKHQHFGDKVKAVEKILSSEKE